MAKSFNPEKIDNVIFYRNNYRALIWLNIFLVSIAITIVAWIFYNKLTAPASAYFATTSDGYLIEFKPKG